LAFYSASRLQRLRLACCYSVTGEEFCEAVKKLPQLEELDISLSNLSHCSFEAIGRCCPRLKTFKFNIQAYKYPRIEDDNDAFAIAQTMPGLRHLQLFGNKMTNDGLLAILDGCLHLESLDIRQCFNVNFNLVASLGKRCMEQVKYLRLPYDATDDYPFQAAFDYGSPAEDPDWCVDQDFLSDGDYEYYEVL